MQILVFETTLSGHRGYYVRVLAQELLRQGHDVAIALPRREFSSQQCEVQLKTTLPDVKRVELEDIPSRRANSLLWCAELDMLRSAIQKNQPEHTYVTCADAISRQWGLLWKKGMRLPTNGPVEGLVMKLTTPYPRSNPLHKIKDRITDAAVLSGCWDRLHTLDPLSYQLGKASTSQPLWLLPEAIEPLQVEDKNECRDSLGLPQAARIIACPGGVQQRKGFIELAEAVRQLPGDDTVLACIGKHTDRMKRFVQDQCADLVAAGKLISRDSYVSVLDFDRLFCAADVISVAYPRHSGSASILIRAALAGKPTICSDWGWIGWAARNYDLGSVCDVLNPECLKATLEEVLDRGAKTVASNRRQAFLEFHTLKNHLDHWTALLRQRAGQSVADVAIFPGIQSESIAA